jgi:TonB family protein
MYASSRLRRSSLFVVVVVFVGLFAGVLLALLVGNSTTATISQRVRAQVDQVRTQVNQIAKHGLEAIGVSTKNTPPPARPVEAPPRAATKPPRKPHALPVTISVKELQRWSTPAPLPLVRPESREPVVRLRDETIYTADMDGVVPPVLIRPQLPSRPQSDVSPEKVGILEIVVSTTGAVERVQLISPSNRYYDRMIVAAAKAWPFEPATKDGRPVRYRMRIHITL